MPRRKKLKEDRLEAELEEYNKPPPPKPRRKAGKTAPARRHHEHEHKTPMQAVYVHVNKVLGQHRVPRGEGRVWIGELLREAWEDGCRYGAHTGRWPDAH